MLAKEDSFVKVAALAATKKCNPKCNTDYICMQCIEKDVTSIDLGNITTLTFSNLNNVEELSGPNSDYTPNIASQLPDPNHWKAFKRKGLHFLHLNVNSLLPKIDEVKLIADIMDNELLIEGY